MKKPYIVIAIIIILLIIAVGFYFYILKQQEKFKGGLKMPDLNLMENFQSANPFDEVNMNPIEDAYKNPFE